MSEDNVNDNNSVKKPYPQRIKRVNWITFNCYCPKDCAGELKKFYAHWRADNKYRWTQDEKVDKGAK